MDSGEGKRKQGKGKLFGSPTLSEESAEERSEDRTLDTLSEYMESKKNPEANVSITSSDSLRIHSESSPKSKEHLSHEWEIEEAGGPDAPPEEDLLQRLDRLEKRLDAFENTTYTFLLYAKQLTDRTVSFFENIFGLSNDDLAQIHDRMGVNYNNKGDYSKAVEAFKKLVEIGQTPVSCFKLGVAYDNNGDFQEAIEAYRRSISLDSKYLKGHYNLAEVYSRTENYSEAIHCLTQAVEIEPENPESHYRLGTVHNSRGSYDQAITAFNRVLSLAPDYDGIYQSLGLAYEQKGEHSKAIECFKKSI